jgi:hypothetical protein
MRVDAHPGPVRYFHRDVTRIPERAQSAFRRLGAAQELFRTVQGAMLRALDIELAHRPGAVRQCFVESHDARGNGLPDVLRRLDPGEGPRAAPLVGRVVRDQSEHFLHSSGHLLPASETHGRQVPSAA